MHDLPFTIEVLEAERCPVPHAELVAGLQPTTHAVQAVGKADITGCPDGEVPDLVSDRTIERREPVAGTLFHALLANMLKRVNDIEGQHVIGERLAGPVRILASRGHNAPLDHLSNRCLGVCISHAAGPTQCSEVTQRLTVSEMSRSSRAHAAD